MRWIIDSVFIQSGQQEPFVHRHFTVPASTRDEAVAAIRRAYPGYISVVGHIQSGMTHYFPAPAQYA